ncbi:MAG: hypothetical protein ACMUIG_00475 [Thermoplasmatota archaeon]
MNIRMERESRIVDKMRKILIITNPKRIKLSPRTLRMILTGAERSEIEVVELDISKTGRKKKYISFNGVPVIQYITCSHEPKEGQAS